MATIAQWQWERLFDASRRRPCWPRRWHAPFTPSQLGFGTGCEAIVYFIRRRLRCHSNYEGRCLLTMYLENAPPRVTGLTSRVRSDELRPALPGTVTCATRTTASSCSERAHGGRNRATSWNLGSDPFGPNRFRPTRLTCLGHYRFRPDRRSPRKGGRRWRTRSVAARRVGARTQKNGGPKGGGLNGGQRVRVGAQNVAHFPSPATIFILSCLS